MELRYIKEWRRMLREARRKPETYCLGDKLYYIWPDTQKLYRFTVRSIEQTKHGISYGGEWNGIICNDYFRPSDTVHHDEVHHSLEAIKAQFVNNLNLVEQK